MHRALHAVQWLARAPPSVPAAHSPAPLALPPAGGAGLPPPPPLPWVPRAGGRAQPAAAVALLQHGGGKDVGRALVRTRGGVAADGAAPAAAVGSAAAAALHGMARTAAQELRRGARVLSPVSLKLRSIPITEITDIPIAEAVLYSCGGY